MLVALASPVAVAGALLLLLLGAVVVPFEPPLFIGLPLARWTTQISPVVSELMNRRPSLSQARPTGRIHGTS